MMAGEVLYFVSDTHLGDGTGADQFRYPVEFLQLLSEIEADPRSHLILLGDFMELWSAAMEAVMSIHAPVFRLIGRIAATRPVTYVVGNHDCLPWYYYVGQGVGHVNVVERFVYKQGPLIALHGHQYDPYNRVKVTESGVVKAPWTRRLGELAGFLERIGGQRTGDIIADLGDWLSRASATLSERLPHWDAASRASLEQGLRQTHDTLVRESPGERGYPPGERQYEEAARRLMRDGARYVLMGHTHHPLVHTYASRKYVNTGSWVWDRYPPTYARYADGQLELMDARTHAPYRA